MKTMNPISSPNCIYTCVYTFFYLHTILWSSGTLSSPSVDTVTYPQHQGCWMSAGLSGSKEDVVFSDQLHSTLRKTELISIQRITNYFNYYKYGYFLVKQFMKFKKIFWFLNYYTWAFFYFLPAQLTGS